MQASPYYKEIGVFIGGSPNNILILPGEKKYEFMPGFIIGNIKLFFIGEVVGLFVFVIF